MYAFVITPASVVVNDLPVHLSIGDVFPADDAIVKQHPSFFADEPAELRRTGQTASRATRKRAAKSTN